MKLCIIFPKFSRKPIGGFKILYQYANILAKDHEVYILYINKDTFKKYWIPSEIKNVANEIMTFVEPKWFDLNKEIKKITYNTKNIRKIYKDFDRIICTSVDTVMPSFSMETKAKRIYFIQGYENWACSNEYLYNTYKLCDKNIVISNWLKNIVSTYSNNVPMVLKNPININEYKVIQDYHNRKEHTIALLYHDNPDKGFEYAYDVINRLKKKYDDLKIYMFGTTKPNMKLPKWIKYEYRASQQKTIEIYNKIQIFLCATIKEGYGLTGLEAMACGAALVSTRYDGVLEYAIDGYNSLLAPIYDVEKLTNNVIELIENPSLRYELIENALESVKRLSVEKQAEKLENIIKEL